MENSSSLSNCHNQWADPSMLPWLWTSCALCLECFPYSVHLENSLQSLPDTTFKCHLPIKAFPDYRPPLPRIHSYLPSSVSSIQTPVLPPRFPPPPSSCTIKLLFSFYLDSQLSCKFLEVKQAGSSLYKQSWHPARHSTLRWMNGYRSESSLQENVYKF